jgi:hypothetical protein
MRKMVIMAAATMTMILAGCGGAGATATPPPHVGGLPFLPELPDMLTRAPVPDTSCYESPALKAFAPCDMEGTPPTYIPSPPWRTT